MFAPEPDGFRPTLEFAEFYAYSFGGFYSPAVGAGPRELERFNALF